MAGVCLPCPPSSQLGPILMGSLDVPGNFFTLPPRLWPPSSCLPFYLMLYMCMICFLTVLHSCLFPLLFLLIPLLSCNYIGCILCHHLGNSRPEGLLTFMAYTLWPVTAAMSAICCLPLSHFCLLFPLYMSTFVINLKVSLCVGRTDAWLFFLNLNEHFWNRKVFSPTEIQEKHLMYC